MASANLVAYYLALRSLSPGSKKTEEKKGVEHSQHEENKDQTPPKEPVSNPEVTEKKDENFELFGDDDEDTAWEERIQKKADEQLALKASSGKEKPVMKSVVVLDVKPWEDTTDMQELEAKVRAIEMEGLEWKASKLVLIGYGIKKLQISCHVVDEKVSVDDIQEKIQEFEEYVQSSDIVQFFKL